MDANKINQELIFILDPTCIPTLNRYFLSKYNIYFNPSYDENGKLLLDLCNELKYPIKLNGNQQTAIYTRIFLYDKIECDDEAFVFLIPELPPSPSDSQDEAHNSNIFSAVYEYLNSDYFKRFGNIGYYIFDISMEIKYNSFFCDISVSTDKDNKIFFQKVNSFISNSNIIVNINKSAYLNLISIVLQILDYHNIHIQNVTKEEHPTREKVNEIEHSKMGPPPEKKRHCSQTSKYKNNENEISKCSSSQMTDSHNQKIFNLNSHVIVSLNINFVGYIMNFTQTRLYGDILKGNFIDLHKGTCSYKSSLRISDLDVLLKDTYPIQGVYLGSLFSRMNGPTGGAPALSLVLERGPFTYEIDLELSQKSNLFDVKVPFVNGESTVYKARAFLDEHDQLLVEVNRYYQPFDQEVDAAEGENVTTDQGW